MFQLNPSRIDQPRSTARKGADLFRPFLVCTGTKRPEADDLQKKFIPRAGSDAVKADEFILFPGEL